MSNKAPVANWRELIAEAALEHPSLTYLAELTTVTEVYEALHAARPAYTTVSQVLASMEGGYRVVSAREARQDSPSPTELWCGLCGEMFEQSPLGRPGVYCKNACRQKAKRLRAKDPSWKPRRTTGPIVPGQAYSTKGRWTTVGASAMFSEKNDTE